MHSEPGQPRDDHGCDGHLIFSAAKLDVYRHERLAYTEPPRRNSASPANSKAALLKAMAAWAMAHL
jgi:hypothetical protein